eukprot:scaffold10247_cov58-Cylindrotheca_fusiformis.AAC.1
MEGRKGRFLDRPMKMRCDLFEFVTRTRQKHLQKCYLENMKSTIYNDHVYDGERPKVLYPKDFSAVFLVG